MKNQKGFTLVEGLLIALVTAVIGFGGYYVYSQQDDSNIDETTKTSAIGQPFEGECETTEEQSPVSCYDPDKISEETSSVPEGWSLYENSEQGFSFIYPEEATIEEQEDSAFYFQVVAEKNDGNNPNLHFYGEGNYKIQLQTYENGTNLADFLARGVDGELVGGITEEDGISKAITRVTGSGTPDYDIYWLEKDETVVSVILYGNYSFEVEQVLNSFKFF